MRGSKSVQDFFKSKKIDIDKKEIHKLTDSLNSKIGKIINFKFQTNNSSNFPEQIEVKTNIKISNIPKEKIHFEQKNNNNNENDNQLTIKNDIKSEFNTHPLIGLQSIGSTPSCINAVLQSFCQSEIIINHFKYNKKIIEAINKYNKKNKLSLTKAFKNLIENLWPSDDKFIKTKYSHKNKYNKYYAPYEMIETISNMSSLFDKSGDNEAKDFINFIIMELHKELNKNQLEKKLINTDFKPNQTNQKEMLIFFINNFMNENVSFISDNFYGTNQIQIQCSGCRIIKYNYEIFSFLIFPLDEIIKNKFLMNINNQNNIIININDCFEFNQKIQILSGDNAIPCDYCKSICLSNYQSLIYTFPNILILILEKNKNSKIKFEIEEKISLKNYILESSTGYKFKLIGIISKLGEGSSNEHYLAFCKSPIDNCWYRYNNDFVNKLNDFKKDINDLIFPYILFYQKVN